MLETTLYLTQTINPCLKNNQIKPSHPGMLERLENLSSQPKVLLVTARKQREMEP